MKAGRWWTTLRAYPRTKGRGKLGEHARAALESFSMAGLASCHPATVERGLRELRALLSLQKESKRAAHVHEYGDGGMTHLPPAECSGCRVARALARLDRLSSPSRGKGRP